MKLTYIGSGCQRSFVSTQAKTASGFKAAKDRLTLLLDGNAVGDFKLKPSLVHYSTGLKGVKRYSTSESPCCLGFNESFSRLVLFI